MAKMRGRYVPTDVWSDPWFENLHPADRYLWIYLLTNPCNNIAGIYEISNRRIGFETGYSELKNGQVDYAIDGFAQSGKLFRMDKYIVICDHPKYQSSSPTVKKGIDNIIYNLVFEYQERLKASEYAWDIDEAIKRVKERTIQSEE